jgi:hypothetical protein
MKMKFMQQCIPSTFRRAMKSSNTNSDVWRRRIRDMHRLLVNVWKRKGGENNFVQKNIALHE